MPVGVEDRFEYVPGQSRPTLPPLEEGDYQLILTGYGKEGMMGWKQKSTDKFPNRQLTFAVAGTEDPISGGERRVSYWIVLHPIAVRRLFDLAEAAGYPNPISFQFPKTPGDAACREAATAVDTVLEWIKDNGVVINAHLKAEEWKGRMITSLDRFLPPTSQIATETASNDNVTQDFDPDAVFASMQVKTKNAKQARK